MTLHFCDVTRFSFEIVAKALNSDTCLARKVFCRIQGLARCGVNMILDGG